MGAGAIAAQDGLSDAVDIDQDRGLGIALPRALGDDLGDSFQRQRRRDAMGFQGPCERRVGFRAGSA